MKRKSLFLIRFAKDHIKDILFMSENDGRCAFTADIKQAFGFKTEKNAELFKESFLASIHDEEVKENLKGDLTIEEHCFGSKTQ